MELTSTLRQQYTDIEQSVTDDAGKNDSSSSSTAALGERQIQHVPSSGRFSSSSSSWPGYDDPLHPTNLVTNTVSDTATYVTLVTWAFNLPLENCAAAGIVGNIAAAVVNSPYVTEKALTLFPEASRNTAKNAATGLDETARGITHPPYLAYYVAAWCALGFTTVPKVLTFILVSSFIRQAAKCLMESEHVQGTLVQQAEELTSPTGQEMDLSMRAFLRVMREFTPELVGALARSGLSNLSDYAEGKKTGEEVLSKTLFSGAVFVAATFLYYVAYRALEQGGHQALDVYGEVGEEGKKQIQDLSQELTKFSPDTLTSNQGISSSSQSSQEGVVVKARAAAFSKAFRFLNSPLTSLFKDPIYRRLMEETYRHRNDPNSQEARKAFKALDTVSLLKKFVDSFEKKSVKEEERRAFKMLLNSLGIHGDVENASYQELHAVQQSALEALEQMFQKYATARTPSSHEDSERMPLVGGTGGGGNYGSTNNRVEELST